MKGLYTNHAGTDILKDCAIKVANFCNHDINKLRDVTILLPTRRAIRIFEEMLLEEFKQDTIFLPRLMPVGDVEISDSDEEEIIPPLKPIAGIERILSIIPFIEKHDEQQKSYDARWRQAKEILKLIDLLQTEGLTPDALKQLDIKMDMAEHWQKSGGLFVNMANDWLAHLLETNRINKAAARIVHIERLTQQYRDKPPEKPVWFIGSTGSILAVRDLMRAILAMPQGLVLLPGLDKEMPDDAWRDIPPAHPQAILKNTIEFLGFDDRRHIQYFTSRPSGNANTLADYLSNALSPHPKTIQKATDNITLVMANNRQEELNTIAHICLEQKQKEPNSKIVIVSNDARMPIKLGGLLNPYGLKIDASMGQKLSDTATGVLVNHVLKLFDHRQSNSILTLWTLLKNTNFLPEWRDGRAKTMTHIEDTLLRDPLTTPQHYTDVLSMFPNDIKEKISNYNNEYKSLYSMPEWANIVRDTLTDLIYSKSGHSKKIMTQITDALEQISSIQHHKKMSYSDFAPIIIDHLNNIAIRENPSKDIRNTIYLLGTLEARLIQSDLTIMANLNEGIWPDAPAPNPYLSRGMRHAVGLPDSERHATLSGHDFWQAFLSGDIIMTSSKRDGDTPALPSRWLLRLESVTPRAEWHAMIQRGQQRVDDCHARHFCNEITPAKPPNPIATIKDAPQSLYVTHVETWRHDPYSFWAKHITNLRKPRDFLSGITAATRGSVWHEIMENFVTNFDPNSNKDTQNTCFDKAVIDTLRAKQVPDHMIRLWQSRLSGQRESIIAIENERRSISKPWKLEEKFEGSINNITVKAKADRVDITNGRALLLADYKTGVMPTKTNIYTGYACQLSLLALIMPHDVLRLDYIDIKGGSNIPKPVTIEWGGTIASETEHGFSTWYKLFFEQSEPFVSYADFGKMHMSKATDYLQLARYDEWGAGSDEGEDA